MDIDSFRWMFLVLAALQLITLIPVMRRLRGTEPTARAGARLDLLDSLSGMTLLSGIGLGNIVVMCAGLALLTATIAAKAVRWNRARARARSGS
ncbi:hypothetical protein [Streptomyces sp. NPDC058084]|uniref:hypothetical protein n=1 Tax=Streptomyces sp. NPDC058084 TaxID=3346333 RepID=UPI0036ED7100